MANSKTVSRGFAREETLRVVNEYSMAMYVHDRVRPGHGAAGPQHCLRGCEPWVSRIGVRDRIGHVYTYACVVNPIQRGSSVFRGANGCLRRDPRTTNERATWKGEGGGARGAGSLAHPSLSCQCWRNCD